MEKIEIGLIPLISAIMSALRIPFHVKLRKLNGSSNGTSMMKMTSMRTVMKLIRHMSLLKIKKTVYYLLTVTL